jgi:PHD/YefM family antitoxin component YafN of YafNO toxin-antitoxin module
MSQEIQRIQLTPQTDLHRLIEQVHADQRPRLIEAEGKPLAVVSPASPPPSQSRVDQETLVTRILANRARRVIAPRTTVDLIREVRSQEQESYGEPR